MTTTIPFHRHRHSYGCAASGLCPIRRLRDFHAQLADVVGEVALMPEELREVVLHALRQYLDMFISGMTEDLNDAGLDLDDRDVASIVGELDDLLRFFRAEVVASVLRRVDRLDERGGWKVGVRSSSTEGAST